MTLPVYNHETDWFADASLRRRHFLASEGMDHLELKAVNGDAAPRNYFRLNDGHSSYILLESPPDDHPQSLAGHKLQDFIILAERLRRIGLSTPQVYAFDPENGYLLLEDFGEMQFASVIREQPERERELYELACDVLVHLRKQGESITYDRPDFEGGYLHQARRQFIDWFVPYMLQRRVTDLEIEAFHHCFDEMEKPLRPYPQGIMYVDYHVENLMFLPQRSGLEACGLLDFAGINNGPPAYDLANLANDIRNPVPVNLREVIIERYVSDLDKPCKELYLNMIPVLALHYHAKVAGQIIRWLYEGKGGYFKYMNVVCSFIARSLDREPALLPFHNFLKGIELDISSPPQKLPKSRWQDLIRDDAFLKPKA